MARSKTEMTNRRLVPNLFQEASSGCLLPLFLSAYVLVSIAEIVVCTLVLLGYVNPQEGLILPIKEVYTLSLLLSFLFLLSIIGIMQEKESGVAGFILVILIRFVVSVFSGGLPNEEINTVVPAIILLLLLRLDEWEESDPKQLTEYYLEAREAENSDPKIALKLYRRLERLNRDVNPALVLIGALSMPLAYLLGQWLNENFSLNPNLVETITLGLAGIGPMVWAFYWWSSRAKIRSVEYEGEIDNIASNHTVFAILNRFFTLVFTRFLLPILALLADWLEIVLCAVIAGISAIIVTAVILIPHRLVSFLYTSPSVDVKALLEDFAPFISFWFFVLLLLVSAAEPRLKPVSRVLPELPTALKTNFENLVSFLTSIVVLLVFINPYMQSPLFIKLDTRGELIQHALAGALLGYTLSAIERFRVFNVLVKLGQARCLRRMGRRLESFYTVYRLADRMTPRYIPPAYLHLVESTLLLLEPLKLSCDHCVQEIRSEARQNANSNLPYFELFNDAIERGL